MFDLFANWLISKGDREPDFLIGGDKKNPYLKRWWLIPHNRFFNIYLHNILHDDDDRALHSHPWVNVSILLRGSYFEWLRSGYAKLRNPGNVVFRRPSDFHRLVIVDQNQVWTLFITGPRVVNWFFDCPKGLVPWQDFVDPENKGSISKGCGEYS